MRNLVFLQTQDLRCVVLDRGFPLQACGDSLALGLIEATHCSLVIQPAPRSKRVHRSARLRDLCIGCSSLRAQRRIFRFPSLDLGLCHDLDQLAPLFVVRCRTNEARLPLDLEERFLVGIGIGFGSQVALNI